MFEILEHLLYPHSRPCVQIMGGGGSSPGYNFKDWNQSS